MTAPVKLYLRNADYTGTALGTYITFQVVEGSGSTADCSDFVTGATLYNATGMADTTKTLAGFNTLAHDYATGVGAWTASPGAATKTYKFTWQLQDNNAANGLSSAATFTWEAQNT
jgi:hypothetical protein